ncbi:MAG: hypothetical protein JNJ45_10900 [Chthonomonas sp.]|nr:hypothetical protein [Chthonomonas sp.]
MQTLRIVSPVTTSALSPTSATPIALPAGSGNGVILHNPIAGSRVALTLSGPDESAPATVDGSNQLFVLAAGASLALDLTDNVRIFAQCDVAGGQVNAALAGG